MGLNPYTREIIKPRATPRLDNPQAINLAGGTARNIAAISDMVGQFAIAEKQAQQKIELNNALLDYQKEMVKANSTMQQENLTNPQDYAERFSQYGNELANNYKERFKDQETSKYFEQAVKEFNLGYYQKNINWQRTQTVNLFNTQLQKATSDLGEIAFEQGANGDTLNLDLFNNADATTLAGTEIYSSQELQIFNNRLKSHISKQYAMGMINANPEKALSHLQYSEFQSTPETPDFNDAMAFVEREEGGFVADDAGAGPTLYGINSDANPEEYAKLKNIYDSGNISVAKNYAREVYKNKYWNEIGADNLPPDLAFAAFDTAVNMGAGTAKQLISQSGGDVNKFIELRNDRYRRIAQNNPEKAQFLNSWLNRTNRVSMRIAGGALPREDVISLQKTAMAEITKRETEMEKQRSEMEDNILDSVEIAKLQNRATPEMYELAANVLTDPDSLIRLENIKKTKDQTEPSVYFDYQQRIESGEDLKQQIINDPNITFADKKTLMKMQETKERPDGSLSPVVAGRMLFKEVSAVSKDPNVALQINNAQTRYEERVANLTPQEATFEKTRSIAIEEVQKVKADYLKNILISSGTVTLTYDEKVQRLEDEIRQLGRNHKNEEMRQTDTRYQNKLKELERLKNARPTE